MDVSLGDRNGATPPECVIEGRAGGREEGRRRTTTPRPRRERCERMPDRRGPEAGKKYPAAK